MANQKLRIKIKAYDHQLLDESRFKLQRPYSASHGEGDRYDPSFSPQVQGFQRAVRAENA